MAPVTNIDDVSLYQFIGRDALLQELKAWLVAEGTPALFCLYGPEGVGKTRLAEEAARSAPDTFGVVCKVGLKALSPDSVTRTKVLTRIAEGCSAVDVNYVATHLPEYCREYGEKALILLDGFEIALTPEIIQAVADLAAKGLHCLVTSRQPLPPESGAINREVLPLTVPTAANQDFSLFESVALLCEYLPDGSPWKDPTTWTDPDRAAMLRLLGATEGVALPIQVLGSNLSDIPSLAEVPVRTRSDIYAWALSLQPEERHLKLASLGAFPYWFQAGVLFEIEGEEIIDWWKRSLIHIEDNGELWIVGPIKGLAWGEQSEAFQETVRRELVAEYVAAFEGMLVDSELDLDNEEVLQFLQKDWRTFYAMRFEALESSDLQSYLSLNRIKAYLRLRGFWEECADLLEHQRDFMRLLIEDNPDDPERLNFLRHFEWVALNDLAHVYLPHGFWSQAEVYLKESAKAAQLLGYTREESHALGNLGVVCLQTERTDEAIVCFEQALALARAGEEQEDLLSYLSTVAELHQRWGDTQKALEYYQELLQLAQERDNLPLVGRALVGVGTLVGVAGQLSESIDYLERGIEILTVAGEEEQVAYAHELLEQFQILALEP